MGSQQSSTVAETPNEPATPAKDAVSGDVPPLPAGLTAASDYIKDSVQSFEPFAELSKNPSVRTPYAESNERQTKQHDESTLPPSPPLPASEDPNAPDPPRPVAKASKLQPSQDASTAEAEVTAWRRYLRFARQVNTDRIDAREKRKAWREYLGDLRVQNNAFSDDLRRFQDVGFTDPSLSRKLLRSSHNLRKAQEELDASEVAMEEAERALTQAEYDLEREAPAFLAEEHDPETSYSLLKGHGFDFSGYQSEVLGAVDRSNDPESSSSYGDPVIISKLEEIASIEDRIVDIRREKAATMERNVLSAQTSPGDGARLDAYDEQESDLAEQLKDQMTDLDIYRDSQPTPQDSILDTTIVSKPASDSTLATSEDKSLMNQRGNFTSSFFRATASVPSYRSLATNIEALGKRDHSPNAKDFVNCWLLYQLGKDPTEVDRYLATVARIFMTSTYDGKSFRATIRYATSTSDHAEDERADVLDMGLHDIGATSAASSRTASDAVSGQSDLGDGLIHSLGFDYMTRLWFQDGTSAHISQLAAPVGTARGMSTYANAGGSHGVFSESVSNLSRGPLPASRNAPTVLRMSSLVSETPPSPPLSTREVTGDEPV